LAQVDIGGYGGSGGHIVVNRQTGQVYVTQQTRFTVFKGLEKVAAVRTQTREVRSMAIDETRGWVYIVHSYEDAVSVISGTQIITKLTTVGSAPRDVTIEPKSRLAYVVSSHQKNMFPNVIEGNVTVLDGPRIVGRLSLGPELLTHVAADPVNSYIYIGAAGGIVITLKDLKEVSRHQVKYGGVDRPLIEAMDANPRTGEVYVLTSFGQLTRFREGKPTAEAKFWKQQRDSIKNMRVHPNTGDVYLVNIGMREVIVVRDMQEIARLPTGKSPLKMVIDPLTGNVYVANFDGNSVTTIHGTEVLTTTQVGWYPYGIGVNPANGWVYVANINDGTVSVLGYPSPNYTPPAPTKAPVVPLAPTRAPTPKPYP
jgi:DNA-binding beta-propeller fold protein YncE